MGVYELLWGVGIVVLFGAIAWAVSRYHSRNRANDRLAEEGARAQYTDPDNYDEKQASLNRQVRRS